MSPILVYTIGLYAVSVVLMGINYVFEVQKEDRRNGDRWYASSNYREKKPRTFKERVAITLPIIPYSTLWIPLFAYQLAREHKLNKPVRKKRAPGASSLI